MASADMIQSLKSDAIADRDEAQAKVDKLDQLSAEIRTEADAAYDQGVKDTQAASENPVDKIYSLDEANQMINDAKKPLEDQIADLGVKMADLQAKVDASPDVETAKEEARTELKAQLLQKYEEDQVAESEKETGFKDLLK